MTTGPPTTLAWRLATLPAQLGTVAFLALATAVATGRPEPVLVAAPCLAALAATVRRHRPTQVTVTVQTDERRCFEDDPIEVRASVRAPAPLGTVELELDLPGLLEIDGSRRQVAHCTREQTVTWVVRPRRWGRWTMGPVTARVRPPGGTWEAAVTVQGAELVVYPPSAEARDLVVPNRLVQRVGSHAGRASGAGVEFAGIRDYVPGDVRRRVNWPVSSRRRALVVNEYAVEHAADVVVLVDTTTDVGPPGNSSLDLAVRAAAGIAQAYLNVGDRVGAVGFGGLIRWLRADVGVRQYYRVVETLLESRLDDSFVHPDIGWLPAPALPRGALVFVLSPLLDERVLTGLRDLRARGHPVLAVDVLTEEPRPAREVADERLALRVWRLDRRAVRHGLREMGVAVLDWDEEGRVPVDRARLEPLLGGRR